MTDDDLARLRDEVAGVLRASELADHIRDARSAEVPCNHWIGQEIAVCAPCVRDRLVPHLADALLPLLARKIAEARGEVAK